MNYAALLYGPIGIVMGGFIIYSMVRDLRSGFAELLTPRPFGAPVFPRKAKPIAFWLAIFWNGLWASIFLVSSMLIWFL